jgi:polyribonucleotide nucleotidyltransferase
MDIKIHGLTPAIIKEAIAKTREARMYILNEVILKAIEGPRPQVNEYAPKITCIQIDPEKIGEVIGQRGKTINQIIEDTGVKIDITDDGRVDICGTDKDGIDQAIKTIKLIVEPVEVGKTYEGEVVRIMSFGAFVQIAPNKDGMIHISKLSKDRVEKVEDVVNIGDKVSVKVLDIREGKISLALKEILA